jgi:hypothetical protein
MNQTCLETVQHDVVGLKKDLDVYAAELSAALINDGDCTSTDRLVSFIL